MADSLQSYARVRNRVGDIGEDQADDVQHRAQEHHGADDGEVLIVDGLDGVTAEPRYGEERFGDQTAEEQQGNSHHRTREDRNQRVVQYMAEQNAPFGQSLGSRGPHVIAIDLLEENGSIPAGTGPHSTDNADDDRQQQEFPGVQPARITGNRHQVPQLADQVLPTDDVEQARYRHRENAHQYTHEVDIRGAEESHQQGESDVGKQ